MAGIAQLISTDTSVRMNPEQVRAALGRMGIVVNSNEPIAAKRSLLQPTGDDPYHNLTGDRFMRVSNRLKRDTDILLFLRGAEIPTAAVATAIGCSAFSINRRYKAWGVPWDRSTCGKLTFSGYWPLGLVEIPRTEIAKLLVARRKQQASKKTARAARRR